MFRRAGGWERGTLPLFTLRVARHRMRTGSAACFAKPSVPQSGCTRCRDQPRLEYSLACEHLPPSSSLPPRRRDAFSTSHQHVLSIRERYRVSPEVIAFRQKALPITSGLVSRPPTHRLRLCAGLARKEILSPQHNGVYATRTAPARWPGRYAKRMRPPRAHMAVAIRPGNTPAAASTQLCCLECCVPTMAQSTNKSTNTQHTPPSSRNPARSRMRAR